MTLPLSRFLLLLTTIGASSACKPIHTNNEIESAMKRYDYFLQKVDADSIASLFTIDGDLGKQAHGRAAIKNFLSQYKDINVLSQKSTTLSIEIAGDAATQKGTYKQSDILPSSKDTLNVSGTFTTDWIWDQYAGWLIKSIEAKPDRQ